MSTLRSSAVRHRLASLRHLTRASSSPALNYRPSCCAAASFPSSHFSSTAATPHTLADDSGHTASMVSFKHRQPRLLRPRHHLAFLALHSLSNRRLSLLSSPLSQPPLTSLHLTSLCCVGVSCGVCLQRPSALVTELDRFIVGQSEAKRAVAVALRTTSSTHTLYHAPRSCHSRCPLDRC